MALHNTCTCDICGKEAKTYSQNYYPHETHSVYKASISVCSSYDYFDLCKDCYYKLKDCIKEMKRVTRRSNT